MSFSILLFVGVATAVVLTRIPTTTVLGFADERCGNVTGTLQRTDADLADCPLFTAGATLAQCIPTGFTNCLIKGDVTTNANLTSDDPDIQFEWLCSASLACGITTTDAAPANPADGVLGAQRSGVSNLRTNGVVGFINAGTSAIRKVRGAAPDAARVVDKRVEYTFSFDACGANASAVASTVQLTVLTHVEGPNTAQPIPSNVGVTPTIVSSVTLTLPPFVNGSSCGSALLRIPHYALFQFIGQAGFAVQLTAGGSRVYVDNVLVRAESTVLAEDGDVCQPTFPTTNIVTAPIAGAVACTRVFINEIRYDDAAFVNGTNTADSFKDTIEIVGPTGTNLTNARVVFVNFLADNTIRRVTVDFDEVVVLQPSLTNPALGSITIGVPEGLGNGTDSVGVDGVAFFFNKAVALPNQFVCYGVNASATLTPGGVADLGACSSVVDLNFVNVTAGTVQSVQLQGCGECYQDFDWGFGAATFAGAGAQPIGQFANTLQSFCLDADRDGFWAAGCCQGTDCLDTFAHAFPLATEVCDGLDTDCVGGLALNETDVDGDGRIPCDGDCDDSLPLGTTAFGIARFVVAQNVSVSRVNLCQLTPLNVNNSQLELCDNRDNDCDFDVDEAWVKILHFVDNDRDGFAGVNSDQNLTQEFPNCQTFSGCSVTFPFGWSPNRTDCDDTDPLVHPDGFDLCRRNDTCEVSPALIPVDNNCNGLLDELNLVDADGDGFINNTASQTLSGNITEAQLALLCPLRVTAFGDCNDTRGVGFNINPNATEICNKIDDNCSGLPIDEGQFVDVDQDGFANFTASNASCIPVYTLFFMQDCNDSQILSNPGRNETFCDLIDNDCNALTPDNRTETCDNIDTDCNCGLSGISPFVLVPGVNCSATGAMGEDQRLLIRDNIVLTDVDGDGAYDFNGTCTGLLASDKDCDDNNEFVFPQNPEICDGVDQDCVIVNGNKDFGVWNDTDSDGFPGAMRNATQCGENGIENRTDCNDNAAAINFNATELACNDVDENCDGIAVANFSSIFEDADGDKFQAILDAFSFCSANVTRSLNGQPLDCNDTQPFNRPCGIVDKSDQSCVTAGGVVLPGADCPENAVLFCNLELFSGDVLVNQADRPFIPDGRDNDCDKVVDNIVKDVAFLQLGFTTDTSSSDSDSSSSDDRRRRITSSSTSSSLSSSDECEDLTITLENKSNFTVNDIVVKGQLTLPPKGSLKEYIFGDLHNFGVKVDTRTLRVAYVQFSLKGGDKASVRFPVCVTHREDFFAVKLDLKIEGFDVPNALDILRTTIGTSVRAFF